MTAIIPTPEQIDAGAKALRVHQMSGRITRDWEGVPKSDQKKWRESARRVLTAALNVESTNSVTEMRQLCLDSYAVIDVLAKGIGKITTPDGFFDLWNRTAIKLEKIRRQAVPNDCHTEDAA